MRHSSVQGFFVVVGLLLMGGSTAHAQEAGPVDRHRGFFIRPDLGLGYMTTSEPSGTALGTVTVSGLAGFAGLAIGGALADNFILSGHIYDAVAVNPNVSLSGTGQSGTAANSSLTALGIGPELDMYFMPLDMYLSITAAITTLSLSVNGQDASAKTGFGGRIGLGQEACVGGVWGLGGLLHGGYASNDDTGAAGLTLTTWTVGLSFTATYNSCKAPRDEDQPPTPIAREREEEATVAGPPSDKNFAICGRAYEQISALADAWVEWNPDREPRGEVPQRAEFLAACGDLPEDNQQCLVMPYGKTHRAECAPLFDALPRRAKYRIESMFLRPAAAPAPTPASPPAPSAPTTPPAQ